MYIFLEMEYGLFRLSISQIPAKILCSANDAFVNMASKARDDFVLMQQMPDDEGKPGLNMNGGFAEFSKDHPDLCSDSSRWRPILKTLSQPCLVSSCYSSGDRGGRATRILPFLYLGSEQDALDPDFLQ
ncbi:unnamed protein product, partial [Notodromas monacha]